MSAADAFALDDGDETTGEERSADDAPRRPRPSPLAVVLPLVLLALAVYLEVAIAIDARVLGAVPGLVVIVLVAIALRFGPVAGAVAGFAAGLLIDLAVQTPVGASALVLTPIGWAAGLWAGRRRRVSLAMAVAVLVVAEAARIAGDALVTVAIEGQGIGWGSFWLHAAASLALTTVIGIPLLALLRAACGVPEAGAR